MSPRMPPAPPAIRRRALHWTLALAALAAGFDPPAVLARHPLRGPSVCGVFGHQPCVPSFCGVFNHGPCVPEFLPPIGQDLRLTIESRNVEHGGKPAAPVDSIRDLFAALRLCWEPPGRDQARTDMQMTVRLSFRRDGGVIGTPRITYATADADDATRQAYWHAITAALDRCTPLMLTAGMAGALAGRPIAIRYIDNRAPDAPAADPAPQ